jgi:hypothetical protein
MTEYWHSGALGWGIWNGTWKSMGSGMEHGNQWDLEWNMDINGDLEWNMVINSGLNGMEHGNQRCLKGIWNKTWESIVYWNWGSRMEHRNVGIGWNSGISMEWSQTALPYHVPSFINGPLSES